MIYLKGEEGEGITVVTRPIKDYARSNPNLYISIVRAVATRTDRVVEFVIKLGRSRSAREHEGRVYDAVSSSHRVVPCVYWGAFARPYALPFLAGAPCLPPDAIRDIERRFDRRHIDDAGLYVVATLFRPQIVSVEQCIRDGTLPPSDYVSDAVRTIRRLFAEKRLVHYDLHHHNQLVDFATGELHLVDLDFATVRGQPESRIFAILPVDLCASIADSLAPAPVAALASPDASRTQSPDRASTRDEVGHFYDITMLFVAHANYVRRTSRDSSRPPPYSPPTPDERRLFRCYQTASAIVAGLEWKPLFEARLGDRFESVKTHTRLLLIASTLVALYARQTDQATVKRRLARALERIGRETTAS